MVFNFQNIPSADVMTSLRRHNFCQNDFSTRIVDQGNQESSNQTACQCRKSQLRDFMWKASVRTGKWETPPLQAAEQLRQWPLPPATNPRCQRLEMFCFVLQLLDYWADLCKISCGNVQGAMECCPWSWAISPEVSLSLLLNQRKYAYYFADWTFAST